MASQPRFPTGLAPEDAARSPSYSLRPNHETFVPERQAIEATIGAISAVSSTAASIDAHADSGSPIGLTRSYQPLEEIGRGGMGIVYRTRQTVLHREIAVKAAKFAANELRALKFISEALVTASLEHPNIIPVYDLTTTADQRLALAMKLVGGTSWRKRLDADIQSLKTNDNLDSLDLEYHLDVLMSVANALAFAHSKGIVHCDVKPSNVLLGEFGEVLLVDWGIAVDVSHELRIESPAPHRSSIRTPCGTPTYMAPELARGAGEELGPWTDVFLLGAILYEILTGIPPHQGNSAAEALWRAQRWQGPNFTQLALKRPIPETLAAICSRALAPDPSDRYHDIAALQEDVRAFRKHQQSLLITARADQKLAACIDQSPGMDASDSTRQSQIYSEFADAVAGFREARVLWVQNPNAVAGERKARLAFAKRALEYRDLGLAEAQLDMLPEDDATARGLRRAVTEAQEARRRARVQTLWLWTALALTALALIVGLAAAYALIDREHQQTLASHNLAEQRLDDIRRLADAQNVARLQNVSQTLWPAIPTNAPRMSAWIKEAHTLIGRLSDHERHLASLRLNAQKSNDAELGFRFENPEEQWEHDNLARLVTDIQTLSDELVPAMKRRVHFARSVYEQSVIAHQEAWTLARDAIASSPRYGGLRIEPQLGLVPIGPDPNSGLWEFAHIQTGEIPTRKADGTIERTEMMGVILVLLPGGSSAMGAEKPSPAAPIGSPHVDPEVTASESPVHTITLAPFFISKYELTQGQWYRFTNQNPSAYPPGTRIGNRVHTELHPVEMIRWQESHLLVTQLALTLPTEAQWEYAARAGTTTIYPTGNDKTSLRGALNIADAYCQENGGPGSWQYELWLNDGYVVHAPVGSYRPNGFGLHDMVGNVWEWCLDRFGRYELPVKVGTGEREALPDAPHVFRGGGFRANAVHARSADRYSLYAPEYRGYDVGMRPARKLDQIPAAATAVSSGTDATTLTPSDK